MNEVIDRTLKSNDDDDDRIVSVSNKPERRLSSNVYSDVISKRLMGIIDNSSSGDSVHDETSNNSSSRRRFTRNGNNSNNSVESLNRSLHETTNNTSRKKRNRQGLDESIHSIYSIDTNDSVDETDNTKSGKGKGSLKGSLKGSQKDQSRISEDEDERVMNSRIAFTNADKKLESKVMNSVMYNNKDKDNGRSQNFFERLKFCSAPISCDSDTYKNWNFIMIFFALITAIYTPYRISFETSRTTPWYSTLQGLELAFDLIFIVNMSLHAFHFYRPASISTFTIEDGFAFRSEIFLGYVLKNKGRRFIIDFISSIPWDFMVTTSQPENLSLKFGLGILRTFRIYWVAEYFNVSEANINLPFFAFRIVKLMMFLLLESHWFACLFYFVGYTEPDYTSSWLYYVSENKQNGLPESSIQRYLLSLYWSWVTTATLGYGDITPQTNREYIICIFYTAFNILFSAYIVGNMTSVVNNNSEQTRIFRQKYDSLTTFIKVNMIPESIATAMKAHMLLQFSVNDEHLEILEEVPDHLKTRCQHFLYRPIIESSIYSEYVSDTFIDHLSCSLRLQVVMPGNDIIVQDDASTVMYFLVSGAAETIHQSIVETTVESKDFSENISIPKRHSFSNVLKSLDRDSLRSKSKSEIKDHVINFLGTGSSIGEVSFFFNLLQPFTVRTSKICRLLMLRRDDWIDKLETLYPIDSTLYKKSCFTNIMNQIKQFREPGHRFTNSSSIDREILEIYTDLERELFYADNLWQHDKVSELCLAAADDNIIALKKILICGISVNASDYDKRNALMVASSKGSINAVKLLLEKGANFGLVDVFGNTALSDACRNSHDSCCSLLYSYGARLSDSIDEFSAGSMMCTAISKGDHAGLMRLLQYGLNPNSGDYDLRNALHVASAAGDLRSIKILLEKGADVNSLDSFGRSPLLEAVRAGHLTVAKMLFDRGATLGFLETERDSVQVERDVLNLSKNDGTWKLRILNSSELVNSVSRLDTNYLRLLLQYGADPNKAFDYDLRSPAHLAVCMNSVELCTLLLEYKADFLSDNSRDRWGATPLDEAKRLGHKFLSEIIQNIIKLTYSKETVDI